MIRPLKMATVAAGLLAVVLLVTGSNALAHDPETEEGRAELRRIMADHEPGWRHQAVLGAQVTCAGGTAAGYPCRNVDLLSVLPLSSIGGGSGNSMWA